MTELELSKHYLELPEEDFTVKDVEKLSKLLAFHSDLYYNKETPIISDYEYDTLFKKLENLEKKFQINESQTKKVWSEVISSSFEKVPHSRPMISLDNTYNEEDLRDFDERVKKLIDNWKLIIENVDKVEYAIEFKFDWLWIELIYKNWELVQAITRWNWIEWEDVSENIKTIKNIPKKIPYKEDLEVRWEVVMPISSFEKLNHEFLKVWEKLFSNPRNAASWSVRLKDSSITAKRNLKFFAYDLGNFEEFVFSINSKPSPLTPLPMVEGNNNFSPSPIGRGQGWGLEKETTYFSTIKTLESFWFEISSFFKKCEWIEEVIKQIDNFWNTWKEIDFDIDWLVIKVNDISLWQEIWFTAHHPRYAIAYKFPAQILSTKILSVEHSIWRTWTITPVANLEPINISWVIVKRATLHNYDEIKNLDIHIWDNIFIKRAWEVIPKVISVIKETRTWKETPINPPEFCPSCGTKVIKDEDKVRYYCPNEKWCETQIKQKIIYSVWKEWLNIDGLWKEQIELFYSLWYIKDLSDVFDLNTKKEEILSLQWYKEKSVNNLLTSIENAKSQDIVSFLTSLNITWIGKQWAKELAKIFSQENDFLEFRYSIEELEGLKDVGLETAKNIFEFFNSSENKDLLKKLLSHIKLKFRDEVLSWKYLWTKMCITWSFENYSREQLIEILEKNWWSFVSSVSVKTDFLLAWEKAWSKLAKANELWVKVISLEEFLSDL